MIGLAIRYRHLLGYGAAVLLLIGAVWYVHHSGYKACEQAAIVKQITITEKRHEIANNKPSVIDTIAGMRGGDF